MNFQIGIHNSSYKCSKFDLLDIGHNFFHSNFLKYINIDLIEYLNTDQKGMCRMKNHSKMYLTGIGMFEKYYSKFFLLNKL
jgi:hypothetical protein